MKTSTMLILFLLMTGFGFSQTKDANNYIVFFENSNSANYYRMEDGAYLDYYLPNKVKFGDHEYYVRVRKYSWGSVDTAYFRENDHYYLHYDPKTQKESVVLPKQVELGQKWLEADSSWSYEIIGFDKKLKTPAKTYKGLIVVECIQLTNRDKLKDKVYHLYFAKGLGLVASARYEELTSYLSIVKIGAKEGETIGN